MPIMIVWAIVVDSQIKKENNLLVLNKEWLRPSYGLILNQKRKNQSGTYK